MKRLLPRSQLAVLIDLMAKYADTHKDLYGYLLKAYNANGGGTLYAVHKDGAVAFQLHRQEFD